MLTPRNMRRDRDPIAYRDYPQYVDTGSLTRLESILKPWILRAAPRGYMNRELNQYVVHPWKEAITDPFLLVQAIEVLDEDLTGKVSD